MKLDIDYLLNEKKEIVSVALLGLIILLAVLVLLKVTSFFAVTAKAQRVVAEAIIIAKTPATTADFASDRQIVSALTANNIFNAIPPQTVSVQQTQRNPITEVRGIVGDKASINGSWYVVGDTIGQAKIVAIDPGQVTILYNDREYVLRTIDASIPQTQQNMGSGLGTQIVNNAGSMNMVGGQTFGRRGIDNVSGMSQAEIERLRNQMTGGFGGGMGGMMGGGMMGGGMMGGGMGGGRGGGMGGGMGGGRGGGGRGGGGR
jgi:hypothetical protein